jgi:putative ABC transport system permease protein
MLSPAHAARPARFVRLSRWWQSWRLALRLARRDAWSHKARSLLIVIMVGAPVLLIGTFATWFPTGDISVRESLPVRLGNAQAEITVTDGLSKVEQLPNGRDHISGTEDARPFESHQPGTDWTVDQLSALTGGRVIEVGHPVMFLDSNGRLTRLIGLALPTTELPTSGLARLVSGRWPSTPDEVAVTETGHVRGLPTTGSVSVRGTTPNSERVVRVVGVASARDAMWRPLDLVTGDPTAARADSPDSEWSYLVFRDRPVSWAEVRDWNRYGLVVVSRAVVLDPPPVSQQPAELAQQTTGDAAGAVVAALITVGLLLETSLMAGPAFAVSAARRRYALAQIAGNGADRAQIRRYVLGEALLLGASAAVIGAGSAVLLAWGAGVLWARIEPTAPVGPLDVSWLALLGLVLAATVSALVAALVPAWGASRVRIADVLAGRERSRPLRRTAPALGLLLVAVTAVLLAVHPLIAGSDSTPWLAGFAAAVLVIGVLLLVPSLLVGLGHLARRLPLPLRLPIRDAARQRSRSASAVAAVTATVATLTILAVANASDDLQRRRDYVTDRIAGHGYLYSEVADSSPEATMAEIRRQHPDWRVYRTDQLGVSEYAVERRGRIPIVAVVLPGCSPDEAIGLDDGTNDRVAQCARYGSNGNSSALGAISESSLTEADVTPQVAAHLRSGGMILTDPRAIRDGVVRLALGTAAGQQSGQRVVDRVIELPALVVSEEALRRAERRPMSSSPPKYADNAGDVGLMTTEGAQRRQIATHPISYEIVDPAGPISRADEQAINDRVLDPMSVERGYESMLRILLGILVGVAAALVLVAALVSTALSQAEGQADLATLAALGSTVGLRRRLAAGQAVFVAGLGTLLGFAAGLLPGTAFALIFTMESGNPTESFSAPGPGIVVVPWLPLAAVVLGVPLLAAAVSALAVRRTPQLTRRLT